MGVPQATNELDADEIIFITEVILIARRRMYFSTSSFYITATCSYANEEAIRETLRSLLRLQLQDPRFRSRFREHFESHPLQEIRDQQEWLTEILMWES